MLRRLLHNSVLNPKFHNLASIARNARYLSATSYDPSKTRNTAIIAHVDHGKTTMMDKLLQFCGVSVEEGERAMDSNDHEKERGITISSKYTRLYFKGHTLNVVDTPGHADFGGEVERIMSMVDGVILLVDASEGPLSQTKFVLSKAIAAKKPAIVVLNKIDKEGHRADEVESELFDLFCALTDDEDVLEYPLLYASGKQGWVTDSQENIPGKDVEPLLDLVINRFPAATTTEDLQKPFGLVVNSISSDNHLGRIVTGKVESGSVKVGDRIKVLNEDGISQTSTRVNKLFYLEGLKRVDVDEAYAGEIVSLAGSEAGVSDTVGSIDLTEHIPSIPLSPPVISMTIGPNDSPLAGKEGTKLTSTMIKNRLRLEVENNVSLQLKPSTDPESIDLQARGELQIGILLDTMRREGFEMTVSPPKVLGRLNDEGKQEEPYEEVIVDVDSEMTGTIIESMSNRKGEMIEFKDMGTRSRLIFHVPARGLMGFRYEALGATRGSAVVNSTFSHYGRVDIRDFNSMNKPKIISVDSGTAKGYSLLSIQERGQLFIEQNTQIYEGMVIGESNRSLEVEVNPTKSKKLTNIRTTGADEKVILTPPRIMNIEETISYMDMDEVMEVTPLAIRLRKRILDSGERARAKRGQKKNK